MGRKTTILEYIDRLLAVDRARREGWSCTQHLAAFGSYGWPAGPDVLYNESTIKLIGVYRNALANMIFH
jgi:hypothetical protein